MTSPRTGYVGTENVGDVLTKSHFDLLPGGLIAYVAYTSDSSTFTNSETDLSSNLTVTFTAGTSRTYRIVCTGECNSDTAGDRVRVLISTGASGAGTDLCFSDNYIGTANGQNGFYVSMLVQPTAGSQSYHIRAVRQSGTGNCKVLGPSIAAGGGAIVSGTYLAVEDVGPAF